MRFTLVHSPDGDVNVHLEDVGGLHGRVVKLGEVVVRRGLVPAHDGECLPDHGQGCALGTAQNSGPVIAGFHQLRCPLELQLARPGTFWWVIEKGSEGFLHVDSGRLDGFHITVELVVDPSVPVRQEDHHVGVGVEHAPQLEGQHLPSDVGFPTRLKADIASENIITAV